MPEDSQTAQAKLSATALSVQDAARLLTAVGGTPVSEEMIELDIADGAPTNANGTIHLVHYAAWLVREMAIGD